MSNVEPGSVVTSIMDGMAKFAENVKVVSDPVQVGDKVIIPAVIVRMGFGAGGGSGKPPKEQSEGAGEGSGAGGGGGLFLTPVFLIVDGEGERLLTIPGSGSGLGSLVEQIKAVVERFSSRAAGEAEESETEEG